MKRFLKLILITVLSVASVCFTITTALAEKTIVADKYTYIGNPTHVFCGDDNIFISGSGKLFVYSYDNILRAEYDVPGIVKAECSENYKIIMTDDGVYRLCEAESEQIASSATDFCLSGDFVYVANNHTILKHDLTTGENQRIQTGKQIVSIASVNGTVYYSVKVDMFGYSDVYKLDGEISTIAYDYCKNLEYLIGDKELTYYGAGKAVVPETKKTTVFGGDESSVSVHDGVYYYVTGSGEFYKNVNNVNTLIFGCTSSDKGYFAFPKTTYSDYGKLYVLDYANDRVAVMENDVNYISIKRPTAITSDYSGNIYVAGKEGIFTVDESGSIIKTTASDKSSITSMAYSNDEIYFVADGKLYKGWNFEYIADADKICAEYFKGKLYVLRNGGIYSLEDNLPIVGQNEILDFDSTHDGRIFAIKKGELLTYNHKGELLYSSKISESASSVSVSMVTNAYTDFGNIIVTCSDLHKVYNLVPDEIVAMPEPDLSYTDTDSIIRTILDNAFIYENPCSINKLCSVKTGERIIVGKYALYETNRMSYVLYEDFSGLKAGYVYKGLIGDAEKETVPVATSASTLYDNTALYRFPSAKSEKIISKINKGAKIQLLNFCDYEYDGITWFKVRYDNKTGFISKDMLSFAAQNSDEQRPQYNAKLTSASAVYENIGGVYVETGDYLNNGDSVEIVGIFDQGQKYTLVKYFDSVSGTKEGYVLTSSLTTYEITPLQIIGLICVGVILLMLIAVCILKFTSRRKR